MVFSTRPRTRGLLKSSAVPPEGLEHLRVIRSPTARRMALRVDPARGDICLVIPKRGSERAAWKFADDNRPWIEQRMATMEKAVPFAHGAVIPILGIERTLRLVPGAGRVTDITLTEKELLVRTLRADPATNVRNYLYRLLEDTVRPMAQEKAARIGCEVRAIQLRDTRSRWGSCSPDAKLMLCWRLVFAPMAVIDYVVAHEVAHLRHMDHSRNFWDVCAQLSEDMEFARQWLDVNGDRLLKYGTQP